MIKNIEIFEHTPVPKAVFKFALPTVLSMIVTVLYNMVDAFFVGQTGDPSQFAAVNVATPIFLFLMAAGNIFGMGGSSFISRALGEKNYEKVKSIASFCLYAGIFTGFLGLFIILFNMERILKLIGTTQTTAQFACDYLKYIAYGGPAIVISTAYTNIIRGEGASQNSMVGLIAGTAVNIVLDPIFILDSFLGIPGLGLGIGIAPLLGYNYGAKNSIRVKKIVNFSILVNVVLGVSLTVLYIIFAKPIINIFSEDPAVVALGVDIIYALMSSAPFIGIMFVLNFTFQGMGKGLQSLVLAVSRQGFVFLPAILIMQKLFGLNGIIFAQPFADAVAVLIAVGMFLFLIKDLKAEEKTISSQTNE